MNTSSIRNNNSNENTIIDADADLDVNTNNTIEEETAYEWLERSLNKSRTTSCPYSNTINSFLLSDNNNNNKSNQQYYNRFPIKLQQQLKEQEEQKQQQCQQGGTGIRIFDHLFQTTHDNNNKKQQQNKNNNGYSNKGNNNNSTVIEISGNCGTGKSSLAISFAVSYILATSSTTINNNDKVGLSVTPPQVIIFDCDNGIHIPNIISILRAGILRKEGQRQQYHHYQQQQQYQDSIKQQEIKLHNDMLSYLQRIHICSPKDYTTDLLSLLEILTHSSTSSNNNYPILLIIDSLSSFEYKTKFMEECIQRGISGKNDFYRHLSRFINDHGNNNNIIILGLTTTTTTHSITYNNNDTIWNKLVTHKIHLQRVKKGTVEEKEGFEFVAIIGNDIIPFSIGNSGVLC